MFAFMLWKFDWLGQFQVPDAYRFNCKLFSIITSALALKVSHMCLARERSLPVTSGREQTKKRRKPQHVRSCSDRVGQSMAKTAIKPNKKKRQQKMMKNKKQQRMQASNMQAFYTLGRIRHEQAMCFIISTRRPQFGHSPVTGPGLLLGHCWSHCWTRAGLLLRLTLLWSHRDEHVRALTWRML